MFKLDITIAQVLLNTIEVHQTLDASEPETIDLTMVKRGVIGVNKIGYVMA